MEYAFLEKGLHSADTILIFDSFKRKTFVVVPLV